METSENSDLSISQIEIQKHSSRIHEKKYHIDLSNDPEVHEIKANYQDTKATALAKIDEKDMHRIINRYGKDLKMDLYTIAEVFEISEKSLHVVLEDPKYKDAFISAKRKRAELLMQEGYEVASKPYDMLMEGKEVSKTLVNAAKLKSNYNVVMARALAPRDWNPTKEGTGDGGGINVVVQTGIKLGI